MLRCPPRSTRTDPLFPYSTLFRSSQSAITRVIRCVPDQIILTSGPRNGLCLTLLALQAAGGRALIEDPGCPVMRNGLNLAGVEAVPVRSEERRVGKACVSTCRTRRLRYH